MNAEVKSLIDSNFGKYFKISEAAFEFLEEKFITISIKSREFLVEAGNRDKFFYLVISGIQAIYLINKNGEKAIMGFSYNGSPSGAYESFILEEPSKYFVEALTDSKLIAINRNDYLEIFERFPEFYKWRTHFIESVIFGRGKREIEMLTMTAKERFDLFMARCPDILLTIPQKYLASYLNMKPETFSRLRAQRA